MVYRLSSGTVCVEVRIIGIVSILTFTTFFVAPAYTHTLASHALIFTRAAVLWLTACLPPREERERVV